MVRILENGLSIKTPLFSFGSMEEGGIIALLDDPYSSFSLAPSFSAASPDSVIIGSDLCVFDFHLFSFYGKRRGMGVLYDSSSLSLGFVAACKAEDCDYQKDVTMRTDRNTLWGIGEYRSGDALRIRAVASVCGYRGLSFLLSTSIRVSVLDFSFAHGHTQAFSSSAKKWYTYLRIGIKDEKVEITHVLKLARAPLYLRQYRDYEYSFAGKFTFGDFILKSSISKSFTDGKERREERVSLTWKWVTLGCRGDNGSLIASFRKDNVALSYEDGKLNVEIKQDFGRNDISVVFRLSSDSIMRWTVTYQK